MKLEDYLRIDAELYPNKSAVICDGGVMTYGELYRNVINKAEELRSSGYPKGKVVPFRSSQTIDFLISYFGLHLAGLVAAPLEKNMPESTFKNLSAELSSHDVPDNSADILYTTGTTGKSKGTIISHKAIIADAENLIEGQGFCHHLAFVINGPLNHIGSLSKIYPVIMQGGTLIITDGIKDVDAFFGAFDLPFEKFATFLVPASIRILLLFSAERLSAIADKLDFLETGAAAISHDDMTKLCQLLPTTRLYNTYASTETGIISTYNFNDGKCMPGCLGKPMRHSQIIITNDGLISCKGDTLMTGYIGDSERTNQILRDGTIYTSDMGVLDKEGMLHLLGREGDVINVGGFKVTPTEVEDAAMAFPSVSDCICISVSHPITGNALKLLVVTHGGTVLDKRALAHFLKTRLEPYKIPMLYEQVESVKRTYNGKLDRKSYKNQGSQ